jgi:SRSO17 transposase
MAARLGLGGHD